LSPERTSRLAEWLLVPHVRIVAAIIPLLDRLLPLQRILTLLTPRRPFAAYLDMSADRIAWIVRERLRRPRQMRRRACLRLSLVLYHFLRLAGIEAVFHVAVFPPSVDPKRLHAHSWVTVGQVCLSSPPEGQWAELFQHGTHADVFPRRERIIGEAGKKRLCGQ